MVLEIDIFEVSSVFMTSKKFTVIGMVLSVWSSVDTVFVRQLEYLLVDLYKFYNKVPNHKRKVGIGFGVF